MRIRVTDTRVMNEGCLTYFETLTHERSEILTQLRGSENLSNDCLGPFWQDVFDLPAHESWTLQLADLLVLHCMMGLESTTSEAYVIR